jgi:hypothetical protein
MLRKVVSEAEQLDTRHWRSSAAVTLTLKQGRRVRPNSIIWTKINEQTAKSAFGHFMNLINRAVYKNAFEKYGKRLRVIPILEKTTLSRWHYHAAIEPPPHFSPEEFEKLIRDCWSRLDWGYREIDIDFNAEQRLVNYMLKCEAHESARAKRDHIASIGHVNTDQTISVSR